MSETNFGKAYLRAWYGQPWPIDARDEPTWRREMSMTRGARARRDTMALVFAVRTSQLAAKRAQRINGGSSHG